jgi:hypothetical protein
LFWVAGLFYICLPESIGICIEATPQAIHHGQQGLGVREVTGPQFATDRLAFSGQDGADDHLPTIRSMVLGKAELAQALTTLTLKVDTGGIKKGQRQFGEQVPAAMEEGFLHIVLMIAQPPHSPIEVMQSQVVRARDLHITPPLICGSIGARLEKPMQNSQINRPLHREFEMPILQPTAHYLVQTQLAPQPTEHQVWTDQLHGPGFQAALTIAVNHLDLSGKPTQGFQQDIYFSMGGQLIDPPQGGQDALHGTFTLAMIFNDLQITVGLFAFYPDKHAAILLKVTAIMPLKALYVKIIMDYKNNSLAPHIFIKRHRLM